MENDRITLAHGAGGKLSQELVEQVILPAFGNPLLNKLHDGAAVHMGGHVAFTTDSYVVKPLFFPGGNIGKLAVCGTVNDLAMTGAIPRYLSMGLILEEGFPIADLKKIVQTMKLAAEEAGICIVTFLLVHIVPGDPARIIAGDRAKPETIEAIRQNLGLDKPSDAAKPPERAKNCAVGSTTSAHTCRTITTSCAHSWCQS